MERNRDAFEKLFMEVMDAAYGTAFHLTRNREDAMDLVQEAAVQAFRSFAKFEIGTNFKAWYFKIMTNLFLKKYAPKMKRPPTLDIDEAPDLFLFEQAQRQGWQSEGDDPASALFNRLDVDAVQSALDTLSDEYRSVAVLYFMSQQSYEEIAEMLGIPVGTVRSRLHRARKALQLSLWSVAEARGIVAELERGTAHA